MMKRVAVIAAALVSTAGVMAALESNKEIARAPDPQPVAAASPASVADDAARLTSTTPASIASPRRNG